MRTLFSGISRGTERLVFEGSIGLSEWERMRCPMQEGAFPFPVKYGYCTTGVVEDGPAHLVGSRVFCLHPHQDFFNVPITALASIPDEVPVRRATLAANMETALNAVWDSGAGPGDRIVVVGAGVVGLLVASLAARLPDAAVTAIDVDESRLPVAAALGAGFARPEHAPADADVVFHASASGLGLDTAINCAGLEATIVEMSWYGDKPVQAQPRRRLPQPPVEARLLAGRPRLGRPAAALGLSPAHAGSTAAVGRAGARCAGGRGDRLRGCAARAAANICTGGARSCPSYPLSATLIALESAMYAVEVRDRIMIAHSLPDPFFGPAQKMHGATFVVDVAFFREALTQQNVVVDIGAALEVLNKTLKPLAYQNLDALPQFKGKLTTTEFLCRYVFDAMAKAAKDGALGDDGKGLAKIRVTLHETDLARAFFEGPV